MKFWEMFIWFKKNKNINICSVKTGLNLLGHCSSRFISEKDKKIFAIVRPKGGPMPTLIVDDAKKSEKVKIEKGILNFSINYERRIKDYLKSLEK